MPSDVNHVTPATGEFRRLRPLDTDQVIASHRGALAAISAADGPDPIDKEVGARIRLRRQRLGMSQNELAGHLMVSFQQVQKYERGANRVSASTLTRIAKALGTTVAELVGEGDEPTPVSDPALGALLRSQPGCALIQIAANLPDAYLRALVKVAAALADPGAEG